MSSSQYFGNKPVRPTKPEECPPGSIYTDEGCIPLGRRKAPRGFRDPNFPVYCGLEKEVPCLPETGFTLPDAQEIPLPAALPGKGVPQGNTKITLNCPSPTQGSITVPANFFVEIPDYDNDPDINASNAAAAQISAQAAAQAFAEATLLCVHRSEAASALCPEGEGSAQSVAEGFFRQQAPYALSPDAAIISNLTTLAEAEAEARLQCYRLSQERTVTCVGYPDSIHGENPDLEGKAIIENNSLLIPYGFVKRLIDLETLTPTQEDVDALRDAYGEESIGCIMRSTEAYRECPVVENFPGVTIEVINKAGMPAGAYTIRAEDPSFVRIEAGRFASSIAPNADLQQEANALHDLVTAALDASFICLYGNPPIHGFCPDPDPPEISKAFLDPLSSTINGAPPGVVIVEAVKVDGVVSLAAANAAVSAAHESAMELVNGTCLYNNIEEIAECDPNNPTGNNDGFNGFVFEAEIQEVNGWYSIRPTVESLVESRKNCPNDQQSGTCLRDSTLPPGPSNPPVDESTPGFVGKIGNVPAGSVFSKSTSTANAIALSLAESSTICLYTNDQQSGTCLEDNTLPPGLFNPAVDESTPGFIGKIGIVPAGSVFSTSTSTANAIALSLAESSTVCLYTNADDVIEECPSATGNPPVPIKYFIAMEGKAAAGSVVSSGGLSDAQDLATTMALAQRVCLPIDDVGNLGIGDLGVGHPDTAEAVGCDSGSYLGVNATIVNPPCKPESTTENRSVLLRGTGNIDLETTFETFIPVAADSSVLDPPGIDIGLNSATVFAVVTYDYTDEGPWLLPQSYYLVTTLPSSLSHLQRAVPVAFVSVSKEGFLDSEDPPNLQTTCVSVSVQQECPIRIGKIPLNGPEGILINFADGNQRFFYNSEIFLFYNPPTDTNWSLVIPVAANKTIDQAGNFWYDNVVDETDASLTTAQTYYRLPIVRDGKVGAYGGTYRENIRGVGSLGPVTEVIKTG